MVHAPRGNYKRRTTAAEIVREHREDADRNTDGLFNWSDLRWKYLSPGKIGGWSPKNLRQKGALVTWIELSPQGSDETRSPLLPRQCSGSVYHIEWTVSDTSMQPVNRFPRQNYWEVDNTYFIQPDFADSVGTDSVESPDGQSGLDDFDCDAGPCGRGEVRSCSCCQCPAGHQSIRARQDKSPTFACNSPNCNWSGESPDVFPARRS
jgi:hypothetical protein